MRKLENKMFEKLISNKISNIEAITISGGLDEDVAGKKTKSTTTGATTKDTKEKTDWDNA